MADNLLDKASILLTPTAYDDGSMLGIKPENGDGDFDFSRSSAATRVNAQGLVENVQIISSELVSNGDFSQIGTEEVLNGNFSQEGSEQISNGSFDTDTKWTTNTGWSISGGSANCDGTQSGNTTLVQQNGIKGAIIDFVVGKTYKVNFDVVLTSGVITQLEVASGVDGNDITTSGNYTTYITAVSTNDRFTITANSDFIGSIDNVSVKEVGQNWDLGNKWSIGENSAIRVPNSTSNLSQVISGISGKTIKVSYEVSNYVAGDIGASADGNNYNANNGNGTFVDYITPTSDNFYLRASYSFEGSITNISVKEVGQDWTLGTGWSIDQANSKAVLTNVGYNINCTQSNVTTIGQNYKIEFTISDYTSGQIRISLGGSATYLVSANGTYVFYLQATINNVLTLQPLDASGTNLSITNISVKEITDDTDLPRINYSGFSYQDSLGSELVTNGSFDTNITGWVAYSNTLVSWESGGYALLNSNNNYWCKIQQSNVFEIGKTYKVILTAKSDRTDLSFHNSPIVGNFSQADTFETFEQYYTATSTIFLFGYANAGNATITIDNVSVKEYLGQEVVPDSGCGSWLLEPQSTNLITESESFSSWNKDASVSITSTDKSSPLGTNNASEITVTDSGRLYHDPTISTTADRVTSIFIKAGTFVNFKFTCIVSSEIDLNAETATNNFGIQKLTNGWFRISTTAQSVTSTSRRIQLQAYPDNTYTNGHGQTGTYFVIGTQMENTLLTSYIPTNGATSTRLQDIANNSGNSSLINSTEGILYAEVSGLANYNLQRWLSLSDGTTSNTVKIGIANSTTDYRFACEVRSGAVLSTFMTYNFGAVEPTFVKIAFKYKENDFALWVNGVEVATDTSGSAPIGLSRLNFDRGDGAQKFEGNTKALAVYKEALTDAELQSLTTQ